MKMCIQQFTETDGNIYTDITHTAGFLDIINTGKTREDFHLTVTPRVPQLVHCVTPREAKCKLYKMRKSFTGTKKKIPHLVSHDGDAIHKVNIIQTGLQTGKTTDLIKFNTVNLCVVTGGVTLERVGMITRDEKKLRNPEYLFNVWIIYK